MEESELGEWAFDNAEWMHGNPDHISVVLVSFSSELFRAVLAKAEQEGKTPSAYIKQLVEQDIARCSTLIVTAGDNVTIIGSPGSQTG